MNLHNGFNSDSGDTSSHLIFLLVTGILLAIMLLIGGGVIVWMKRSGTFVR